jgi:hypothetical protein
MNTMVNEPITARGIIFALDWVSSATLCAKRKKFMSGLNG